jgi:AraC-like DNA-binding protein
MTAEVFFEEMGRTESPAATWEALASVAKYKPKELARAAAMPLGALRRHFSSRYGLALGTWLKEVRQKEAYQRLLAGDSVKEVASDLGYKRVTQFSRDFEAYHGVPPSLLQTGGRLGERIKISSRRELAFNL